MPKVTQHLGGRVGTWAQLGCLVLFPKARGGASRSRSTEVREAILAGPPGPFPEVQASADFLPNIFQCRHDISVSASEKCESLLLGITRKSESVSWAVKKERGDGGRQHRRR